MKRGMKQLLSLMMLVLALGLALPSGALAYTASSDEDELSEMTLVAESENRALYLDESGAVLRLVDLASGVAVDTKLMDGDSGNDNYKANQKSDFIITYWDNSSGTKTSSATTQTNYTMAIASGQVEYEEIANGIRVTYTLKEDKLTMDCVPKYITQERMEELVFAYLTTDERDFLLDYYRLYDGYYTRTKDGSSGITQSTIATIQSLFFETGAYTDEDLTYDNESFGYESTWDNMQITVSMEYTLDGDDLVIRLPLEDLIINKEDVVINTITLMPYFLSATQEEDGYFVVPDGSGALINFNNGMTNATDYSSRVYGSDVLINADTVDTTDYYANMPVIGVVYEDYAILNIVEEGDALAEINARISGKQDNYNNAYFKFYITESENVSTSTTSGTSVIKYTGDTYTGDIVLRYQLFTEEKECNYTSLAKNYQEYLVEQGVLTYQEDTEQSLVVELFGSALESKSLMGVPYYGVSSFTSYAEAQEILQALADGGVDSALIQMDGWLDGGESHEVLTSASLESNQGSKKDFNALLSVVEELGYAFYPDVDLQLLHPSFDFLEGGSAKSYAKKYGSRFLDNDYALLKVSDIGTLGKTNWNWTPYLVSPSNLVSYVEKAIKNLSGLGVSGYTVTDLGMNLVADYNEKASVSRISAAVIVQEAIETLSESAEVVMQSPYQYAWTGVTVMTDLPTRSCQYSIFNQDIPFLQLVLDGCVSYSTEPLNDHPEDDTEVMLMTCIETRSNPKFYLMASEMESLKYLADKNVQKMSITFSVWEERVEYIYQEYAVFCEQVEGSVIISHEYLADNVVRVEYDNGVCVYLNYTESTVRVDGQTISAESYLIVKEG